MSDDPINVKPIPQTAADNGVSPGGSTVPVPAEPALVIEADPETKTVPAAIAHYIPNRHDHRRQATIARRERKQKTRKH